MQRFSVQDHADSYLPEGKKWKLIWEDEFDGTVLDDAKWDRRLHMMGRRAPHWVEDAVRLDGNSNAVFSLEYRNGVYCSTQLQTGHNFMDMPGQAFDAEANEGKDTPNAAKSYFNWPIGEIKQPKFMHRYGYYECRCKMQHKPGWWCAFWLQSPVIGSSMNPETAGVEVDIMEQFQRTNIAATNNHWNGYGKQHESTGSMDHTLAETPDGYHTFGLEWTKDNYRYYYDGKLVRVVDGPVSQIEQFVMLSTEAIGYRSDDWTAWEDLQGAVGDVWLVDHVRVFDAIL